MVEQIYTVTSFFSLYKKAKVVKTNGITSSWRIINFQFQIFNFQPPLGWTEGESYQMCVTSHWVKFK